MLLKTALVRWIRRFAGHQASGEQRLLAALDDFRNPEADELQLLRQLIAALRPADAGDEASNARYALMLERLESDAGLRAGFRHHLIHFVGSRRLLTFFTDSGILPGTGFFSEWWRILGNRILPEAPDERRVKDCLHLIFDRRDDWRWLEAVPAELSHRFWEILAPPETFREMDRRGVQEQMLDAVLLLAHRVSGLGVDGELMRASPNLDDDAPRFIALSEEALEFVRAFRAGLDGDDSRFDRGDQLLVIVDQCQETLKRIRKRALTIGTSLHLSYLLTRSEQSLTRIAELTRILTAGLRATPHEQAIRDWASFARAVFLAENRRHSLRHYMQQLSGVLAVRVTENAARSGEHYICESRADYGRMWRSAAGAGVLIALMALLKIKAAALHAPLFVEAFMFSMIYGLGFVAIFLLGFTVATKQPAMTAQTLASLLGELKPTRQAELERIADVAAAVSRSQLAAIAGNVMVALPVAIAVGFGLSLLAGQPAVDMEKAVHLLADIDPLSWAIPHAAIAGFYLFLSGLISGYFDNRAAYASIGPRIGRLRWLQRLAGKARAERVGSYIEERLGGIMGNFLFGCMLGSTGMIGTLLGLPLDIRHIAFASANLGYAVTGFDFAIAWQAVLWGALGVALIGLTNLGVSFALALRTALGARRIAFSHWGTLLGALWRRFRQQPRSFLLPPPENGAA
ncbi:site-specific recombinase [Azonexus fungiphilus]|jgi:site-specific recombinase|uniref:Site-specific recombinase n=1 Tax=Azonexus fungiphilus TaxID=146940 RepID=A0A495WQ20_9RHOO|nr:site-specific recombinase [Azonexus fungiphilus]